MEEDGTVIRRQELARLLRQLADLVESGDSAEGSLQYTYAEGHDDVRVSASIRTGNLEGQGGMFLL